MNLIVDMGNTAVKLAVVEGNRVVEALTDASPVLAQGTGFVRRHRRLPAMVASVRREDDAAAALVRSLLPHALALTPDTPLPITNLYGTPRTLGSDRLAAAVGAASLYPRQNVLVVDAGTAITYELVSARGEYLGGNISPGIDMRFKALHHFAGRLPLCRRTDDYPPVGADTQSAIAAGVLSGVLYEVQANVEQFSLKIPNLRTILTGGDAVFLAGKVKMPIFVVLDLVLIGLNKILEHVQAKR